MKNTFVSLLSGIGIVILMAGFIALPVSFASRALERDIPAELSHMEPNELGVGKEKGDDAPDTAKQVMEAFAMAYPTRIQKIEFREGDWAVYIPPNWFYYTGGRLLPDTLRDRAQEYDPHPMYTYPTELPLLEDIGEDEKKRLSSLLEDRRKNPLKRAYHFFDALWRSNSKEESYERQKTLRFLGREILIHYSILEEVALVEEMIKSAAKNDSTVQSWISDLDTLTGWNWRNIAETESRSFHAYGTAIDCLPRSKRYLDTYWLWSANHNSEWWAIPYEKRLHPPEKVIQAFEANGFIWGGKWRLFDTMHFEYRPEILILNGIPIRR